MSRAAILILLLAAVALMPLAAADHAYSHRYIIFGRVVDSAGNPVPGVTAQLAFEGTETEGPCGNQPGTETQAFGATQTRPTTNEYGEFMFCAHAHRISRAEPGVSVITIPEFNVRKEVPVDPFYRHLFLPIQLDTVHPNATPEAYERSYTVQGTLWTPGDRSVEGVGVFGATVDRTNVSVTLALPGQEPVSLQASTNNYGDFAVRFPVTSRPTAGTVTIEAGGKTFSAPVDATFAATNVRGEFPEPEDPTLRRALLVLGALVLLGAVGGGAVWGYRRYAEKAEVRELRARTTRKRSR